MKKKGSHVHAKAHRSASRENVITGVQKSERQAIVLFESPCFPMRNGCVESQKTLNQTLRIRKPWRPDTYPEQETWFLSGHPTNHGASASDLLIAQFNRRGGNLGRRLHLLTPAESQDLSVLRFQSRNVAVCCQSPFGRNPGRTHRAATTLSQPPSFGTCVNQSSNRVVLWAENCTVSAGKVWKGLSKQGSQYKLWF